jgi:hypothetical protein
VRQQITGHDQGEARRDCQYGEEEQLQGGGHLRRERKRGGDRDSD